MYYRTASDHWYYFHNGRVSNVNHNLDNTPVWSMAFNRQGCMRFRTSRGWYLTTPVLETVPA